MVNNGACIMHGIIQKIRNSFAFHSVVPSLICAYSLHWMVSDESNAWVVWIRPLEIELELSQAQIRRHFLWRLIMVCMSKLFFQRYKKFRIHVANKNNFIQIPIMWESNSFKLWNKKNTGAHKLNKVLTFTVPSLNIELIRDLMPIYTLYNFGPDWMRNVASIALTRLKTAIFNLSGPKPLELLDGFRYYRTLPRFCVHKHFMQV